MQFGPDDAFHLVQRIAAYEAFVVFFADIFPEFKKPSG
jgi:ribosome-associated toxin RatA of RatAB toxin-antitoxin module